MNTSYLRYHSSYSILLLEVHGWMLTDFVLTRTYTRHPHTLSTSLVREVLYTWVSTRSLPGSNACLADLARAGLVEESSVVACASSPFSGRLSSLPLSTLSWGVSSLSFVVVVVLLGTVVCRKPHTRPPFLHGLLCPSFLFFLLPLFFCPLRPSGLVRCERAVSPPDGQPSVKDPGTSSRVACFPLF